MGRGDSEGPLMNKTVDQKASASSNGRVALSKPALSQITIISHIHTQRERTCRKALDLFNHKHIETGGESTLERNGNR